MRPRPYGVDVFGGVDSIGGDGSVIEKAATEQSTTNPNNVQGFGAAPAAPAADAQQATPAAPAEEKK